MKQALFVLFFIPSLAFAIEGDGVVWRESISGARIKTANTPLPAPSLTLEEVAHLRAVGTMVLSERDLNVPHLIRGIRYEMLSAQQIINFKVASAIQYGLKVAIRDPSQSCNGGQMCAVLVVTGRAQNKAK